MSCSLDAAPAARFVILFSSFLFERSTSLSRDSSMYLGMGQGSDECFLSIILTKSTWDGGSTASLESGQHGGVRYLLSDGG